MAGEAGSRASKTAAVIGAGPAGLVSAKILKDKRIDVTVYEIGSVVGGTWVYDNDNGRNYLYRNLHINTSKRLTQFSHLPFNTTTQRIPDHRDMAQYLRGYASQFQLISLIRFNSEVISVSPIGNAGDGQGWSVTCANGQTDQFDMVVVCTGPFSRAAHVDSIRFKFTGEYLHSSEYRAPDAFIGKRVCIIGAGNSAVDIASDICATAKRTTLVARSPVIIMPHFVFGRAIGDIGALMQKRFFPAPLRRKIMGWLIRAVHGDMISHGFKPLVHRVHATISSTIVQDILFERVTVKHGIAAIEGKQIKFLDGANEEFDSIIAATGFVTEFPFLKQGIVPTADGRLDLYKRIAVPGVPGLYFVGMINIDTPINYACERQAEWIAAVESENLVLPAADEMRADMRAKKAWVNRTFGQALRHSLQEDSVPYYAELARALHRARKRSKARRARGRSAGHGAPNGPATINQQNHLNPTARSQST